MAHYVTMKGRSSDPRDLCDPRDLSKRFAAAESVMMSDSVTESSPLGFFGGPLRELDRATRARPGQPHPEAQWTRGPGRPPHLTLMTLAPRHPRAAFVSSHQIIRPAEREGAGGSRRDTVLRLAHIDGCSRPQTPGSSRTLQQDIPISW